MMRLLITTTLLSLFTHPLLAQSADLRIEGVIYGSNGLPLRGATLTLLEGEKTIQNEETKPNGLFHFDLKLDRQYTLNVSKEGFEPQGLLFNTKGLSKEEKRFDYKLSRLRITMAAGSSDADVTILHDYRFDHERGNFVNSK